MLFSKWYGRWAVLLLLVGCTTHQESSPFQDFASFDQTRISYSDEGHGPPVVLIHGFISNGSMWDKSALKHELLGAGYRVIIPDLRGNGRSDKPQAAEAYQHDAEIKDLKLLADHLDLRAFRAVGYSRGSIVLAKWLTQERRITKAVIGGMGADFSNPDWDRRIAFADAFSGRAELTEMTRGAVEYAQSIGADLKILGHLQDFQPVTTLDELQQIDQEIRVICGNEDLDNGDPYELAQHLPNAHVSIVSGDHNQTYKQENFAKSVMEFLEK
ncbi:alpha/beta fold hydrolase [Pontibacter sp. G13]|uniref:alpha/beta fold hydrolase n=1 Tax=Pontibacter sp. G13 TaxID=3074898 RepID=UPI00288A3663|nr:alpha/beta fold hydrolase [Pontibacter sp. G13]WNJ18312.1 alpha/beta fold hydrolase [Pontibacter sp. G13]